MTPRETIHAFLADGREAQTRFLAELVQTPSDNPPGDCRPHAEKAARLLEEVGFKVERHPVPDELTKRNGMISCTNLIVRERFGAGATRLPATRTATWCRPARAGASIPTAR